MKIKKTYIDLFKELKEILSQNRIAIIVIIGVFILGFTLAYTFSNQTKLVWINSLVDKFGKFDHSNKLEEFKQIFLNNTFVTTLEVFLGFTLLIPLGLIAINGLAIGITTDLFSRIINVNIQALWIYLAAMVPHGIVEIPTVFLGAILGLLFGLKIYFNKSILPKYRRRDVLASIIKIYIFILIPLLAIAALIEVFVTPLVVQLVTPQKIERQSRINSNSSPADTLKQIYK
jgi:stage II sporulation protein M